MAKDIIDKILDFGSTFDWITPIANELSGYDTLEYSGEYDSALAYKVGLEHKGIDCRLERGGGGRFMVSTKSK